MRLLHVKKIACGFFLLTLVALVQKCNTDKNFSFPFGLCFCSALGSKNTFITCSSSCFVYTWLKLVIQKRRYDFGNSLRKRRVNVTGTKGSKFFEVEWQEPLQVCLQTFMIKSRLIFSTRRETFKSVHTFRNTVISPCSTVTCITADGGIVTPLWHPLEYLLNPNCPIWETPVTSGHLSMASVV